MAQGDTLAAAILRLALGRYWVAAMSRVSADADNAVG
jgi:hypothetical protein